jgi:GNAT superfamily N-acetyltransferase
MRNAEVRRARARDLPALLALYYHLHSGEEPPTLHDAEKAWAEIMASASYTVFVVEGPGGILIASCSLFVLPNLTRGARPQAMIENVVTHRDHRKLGLGKAVLEAAITAAREAGCYKIFLATGQKDEATLRFYEGAGFKRNAKTYFEIR